MPGDVLQARPIQSGPTTGDDTIITSGLNEGDRVVDNGQYKLQQNAKVTVNGAPAPATPAIARGATPTLAGDDTQSAQKLVPQCLPLLSVASHLSADCPNNNNRQRASEWHAWVRQWPAISPSSEPDRA
jgi:hypothetical protein